MQFNGMNPGNLERHTKQSLNSSKTETLLIMTTINPSFLNRLIRIISQSKKHGERGGACSDGCYHGGDAVLYKDCSMRILKRDECCWTDEK